MPERILTLLANDHPGALLHVLGLLARRGFRATAVSAAPAAPGSQRVLLHVTDDGRIPRLERELRRLYDVREVADTTPGGEGERCAAPTDSGGIDSCAETPMPA